MNLDSGAAAVPDKFFGVESWFRLLSRLLFSQQHAAIGFLQYLVKNPPRHLGSGIFT